MAQTKNFDKAKQLLQKAIKIQPNAVAAHNNLGIVFKKLGKLQKSISSFEKAIQINPNYADAHYNLGIVLQKLGEYQKAINEGKKAIKIFSKDENFYRLIALSYFHKKEYEKAEKMLS